jgi:D-3-phosphoglycerate dehydrogenase
VTTDVLAIGDRFIPATAYAAAIAGQLSGDAVRVRTVDWAGSKADQHTAQQRMEASGPGALPTPAELAAAVPGAAVLCLHFAPIGAGLLRASPALRLVAVARTGLENVDVRTATARGVGVVPVYGRNASAVAELQLGLMLAEARNIARADASVKAGGWRKEFPGERIEISGRTVGMVGFGHVGRHFAAKLSGFACRLLSYDPYAIDAMLAESGVERAATLDEVFAESDFVVVQARHTIETERFIGRKQFALMKPGAYFVNVARSRVVDTDALYEVLAEGRIAGAGLDVFDTEPLAPHSPWRTLDNATFTTHFGGDTVDTNRVSAALVADAVAEFVRTGRCATAVNAVELGWT